MSTTASSVAEYLSSNYRPDCDFVDGEVVERNVGERDHAYVQGEVFSYFRARRKQWGVWEFVEQWLQVSATRFSIPDVCVPLEWPVEQVFTTPPFICVEILSPRDSVAGMNERLADFLSFGVPYVLLLDSKARKAWRCTSDGMMSVAELRTENPEMVVPLAELFD